MALESALVKPVVDAIMALLRRGENMQLNRNAEKAVREAIRELLLASPDENKAAARIAVAKAAGLLSEDVVLAEDMLQKHRATKAKTRGKSGSSRKRVTTKAVAKSPAPAAAKPARKAKPPASGKAASKAVKPKQAAASKTAPRKATPTKSGNRRRSDDTD
ncbi:MAG: hypothetical protein IAE66_04805 [Xanthomonadaceae bacterium]|nr:hypothetical protein [Xanthomonadaceae bacterium]